MNYLPIKTETFYYQHLFDSENNENAIKNFDLGGFLVTVYRLITDTKYILKIKEEFIFNEWDRIVESKNNIFNI